MSTGTLKIKVHDADEARVVPVAKSTATVGAGRHCDVVIAHESVEPEHARAWIDGGRLWIQDLGTTGGTYLNGIRLPPLKPMLVRENDLLKLGDSEATLSLEAVADRLVRAPVVKKSVTEVTATDVRTMTGIRDGGDLDRRREELAKVSRELAEIKLQLQMAKLEKNSTDELRKTINGLREDVRQLGDQRDKLNDTLKKLDDERHRKISSTEADVVDMKMKAEKEMRDMRDAYGRKLEHWKVDAIADLNKQVHRLTALKQKEWTLGAGQVADLENEMNQIFRRVLLEEEIPAAAVPEISMAKIKTPVPETPQTKARPQMRPSMVSTMNWNRVGMVLAAVVALTVLALVARPYVRKASPRGLATVPETTPPPAARPSLLIKKK